MNSWRKELSALLRLGIPVSLAHLANMSMQLVDVAFVGRLGPEAIGGISVGNAVFSTIMVAGVGLSLGLDFLISKAHGAGDQKETQRLLVQGFYLATIVALPSILLMHVASHFYERFGIAPAIADQASLYLRSVSWSLWPWLLFTAFRQYLQSTNTALPILVILVITNLINALGNWVFVFGHLGMPALGIQGSGAATLGSRIFMLASIVAYTLWRDRKLGTGLESVPLRFSRERIGRMFALGIPASGQLLLEVGVFAGSTLIMGTLGAYPLAAHQIVLQIASFTFMVPLGLSTATAVRIAQGIGAGNRASGMRAGWQGLAAGGAFMTCTGLTLALVSGPILRLFTQDPQVIAIGSRLLAIAAFFQIFDGLQVVATGALRGVGNTRASMIANMIGHWVLGLPIGVTLCFALGWGASGLWVGLCIGLVFVAVSLVALWKRISAGIA